MLVRAGINSLVPSSGGEIKYLSPSQLERLIRAFEDWVEAARGERQLMRRLRHWIIFLALVKNIVSVSPLVYFQILSQTWL